MASSLSFALRRVVHTAANRAPISRFAPQTLSCFRYISDDARANLDKLVTDNNLVVFMKGTPDAPQCGFSRTVCIILEMHGIKPSQLTTRDVLSDPDLRQDIKEYSEWPTVPQVYVNGEFIGGCDIMLQMHQSGEIVEALKAIGHESTFTGSGEDDS
eukprot:m.15939 g.15939  ORF g.15939 m.15939 type:complete len:157 (+) comp10833_c0_seq1:353-823(+)